METAMARKHIASEEMLHLSAAWTQPKNPANLAILASTDLAAFLPRLVAAHQELAEQAHPLHENPRLEEIAKQQTSIDHRHDDVIRGSYAIFTGIADLLGPEHGAIFLDLRDKLIPEGLSSSQKTYSAEAGQAAQLAARITPEIRTTLSKIRLDPQHPSHTLAFFLDEWISLGQELGDLETEKNRIGPETRNQASLLAARNKWIRTVNLFVALAEAAEIDPATHQLLFGPLLAAEQKSNKRAPKTPPPTTESP
jgi:hypothetical protein